ncbi:MAG: hypothetical protein IKV94_04700 [Clostridia bacterium]|nr:hypothetical protein [Clostridia bacterium]
MKLNKEVVKKGFKNLLISIGYMIIFNIISFALFWLSYVGTEDTGRVIEGLFATTEYKCNLFFMIFSWALLLVAFSIFYTRFWKKRLKKQVETHWLFVILFALVSLFFAVVEIILLTLVSIVKTGIFSTISNFPRVLPTIVIIYLIVYVVFDFILETVKKVRDKRNI